MGDFRTTAAGTLPLTQQERKLKRRRWVTTGLLLAILLIAAGFALQVPRIVSANGYVTTEQYAEVRAPVVGTVAGICVQSGARVNQGDLLVQLDCAAEQDSLEEAQRQVQKAEAELIRREGEAAEKKRRLSEDIAVADLRLQNTSSRLARTRELLAKGLVSGSALEDDKLKEALARAELTSLKNQDLSLYEKDLDILRRELDARREAAERAATAVRARAIRAPIAGHVLRYEFVIGELVRPDTVLMEIFGGAKQIMKLRVSERYATRVQVGNRYEARLGSYRGLRGVWFTGRIEYLRNVIQSEGQIAYRVAYCSFDPQSYTVPPGTTAEARIYCGKTCLWFYLFGLD